MFEPGQRVRCVNSQGWITPCGVKTDGPECGGVYTVMLATTTRHVATGEPAEFVAVSAFGAMRLFLAKCFRPLEDAEFERLREFAFAPTLHAEQFLGAIP